MKSRSKKSFWESSQVKLLLFVTLCTAIYLFLFSSDQHVSYTKLTIKEDSESSAGSVPLLAQLGGGSNGLVQDALLLKEYIYSNDMLYALDSKFDLKGRYKKLRLDIFSQLWLDEQERFLTYYHSRLGVKLDELSGIATLEYRDEDPNLAQAILEEIVANSERFINKVSKDLAVNQIEFAEFESVRIKENLREAEEKLKSFQSQHNLLTPDRKVESLSSIVSKLEAELITKEIELKKLKEYLSENAFEVKSLRSSIAELQRKIAEEKTKFTNQYGNHNKLNEITLEFQNLLLEVELLREAYKSALATLQAARSYSLKQIKYLVIIDPPTLSELAEYPRRWYIMLLVVLIGMMVIGLVNFITAVIGEHEQ